MEYARKQYPDLDIHVMNRGTTFIIRDKVTWKNKKEESEKLNEVKDTDFIVYADTVEGPLYLSGLSTTFKKEDVVKYPTEKEAEEALADYKHNVVDYDNFKFKVARLNESKKLTEDMDRVQNELLKRAKEWISEMDEEDQEYYSKWSDDEIITEWFSSELYPDDVIDLCKEINIDTYNGNLQLSDDHVLFDIVQGLDDKREIDEMLYGEDVTRALEDFESECKELDGEVYTDGRMGRHIVIKPTLQNIINYDTIKEQYMEDQQSFIDSQIYYYNHPEEFGLEESKKVTESNTGFIDLSEVLWYAEQYLNDKIGKCTLLQRPDGQLTITLYDNEDKWLNLHNQLTGLNEAQHTEDYKQLDENRKYQTLNKGDKFVNPNGVECIITSVDTEHLLDGEPQVTYQIGKDYKCYKQSSVKGMLDQNKYKKVTELYDPIESTLPNLAREVQEFLYDFDTYDYKDNYMDDEEAYEDVMQTLTHPESRQQAIDKLNEIIKEDNLQDIKDKAKELIDKINALGKELEEYDKKEESRVEDGNVILTTPKEGLQNVKKYIDGKLGNIFSTQFVDADDVVGLKLTRKQDKIDLIPVMDNIINSLEQNGYTRKDYEIELMGDNLILGMNNIAQ